MGEFVAIDAYHEITQGANEEANRLQTNVSILANELRDISVTKLNEYNETQLTELKKRLEVFQDNLTVFANRSERVRDIKRKILPYNKLREYNESIQTYPNKDIYSSFLSYINFDLGEVEDNLASLERTVAEIDKKINLLQGWIFQKESLQKQDIQINDSRNQFAEQINLTKNQFEEQLELTNKQFSQNIRDNEITILVAFITLVWSVWGRRKWPWYISGGLGSLTVIYLWSAVTFTLQFNDISILITVGIVLIIFGVSYFFLRKGSRKRGQIKPNKRGEKDKRRRR